MRISTLAASVAALLTLGACTSAPTGVEAAAVASLDLADGAGDDGSAHSRYRAREACTEADEGSSGSLSSESATASDQAVRAYGTYAVVYRSGTECGSAR